MYYIILDMEWNQALDRAHTVEKPVLLRGEIIQIGAVKCDEDFNLVDRLKICLLYTSPSPRDCS